MSSQDERAGQEVDRARAENRRSRIATEAVAEDHPARIQHVDAHAAGLTFQEREELGYVDAAQAAFEELEHRETATTVVHGHDDFVDVHSRHRGQTACRGRREVNREPPCTARRRAHEADEGEAAPIRAATQIRDRLGIPAAAVDEHPTLEDVLIHAPRERGSRHDETAMTPVVAIAITTRSTEKLGRTNHRKR